MEESGYKNKENKKVTEIKTFTVPFSSKEGKKNITTTNTPSQTSKEQIINQALLFHSQGNISEATKYYQYALDQGFSEPAILSNYGISNPYL